MSVCTGCSLQVSNTVLPFIWLSVQGINVKALADTGCEQSVVQERLAKELKLCSQGPERQVIMLNGETTTCRGETTLTMRIGCHQGIGLRCMITPELAAGCRIILEMDGISKLGGVTVNNSHDVVFPAVVP